MMSLKNILSKQTLTALTAIALVALTANSVNAQVKVVDTTDIMKEFDENSFRDRNFKSLQNAFGLILMNIHFYLLFAQNFLERVELLEIEAQATLVNC